jgi:predicted ATPase
MEGKRLINSIVLKNFLSFGNEGESVDLGPLNVFIGPNASGKSNFVSAVALLTKAVAQGGLSAQMRGGGGVEEFLWKGEPSDPIAEIDVIVHYPEVGDASGTGPLRYKLCFTRVGQRVQIVEEVLENASPLPVSQGADDDFYYRNQNGHRVLKLKNSVGAREKRSLDSGEINPEETILSQRRDPDTYPEITYLAEQLSKAKLYAYYGFPDYVPPRAPQRVDTPDDFLAEDARNLALVLNSLDRKPKVKEQFIGAFRKLYDAARDIRTITQGGVVQIYVYEKGAHETITIPATRLSDGTLRYLCLLTILCHPTPPPLVCIEEPELGLHPDILPTIAELLIDASKRTQLIVTTHSDALVSAFTESPECVLVCEHDLAGTHLRRLTKEKLTGWLDDYSLGDLWRMGEIGGNRW